MYVSATLTWACSLVKNLSILCIFILMGVMSSSLWSELGSGDEENPKKSSTFASTQEDEMTSDLKSGSIWFFTPKKHNRTKTSPKNVPGSVNRQLDCLGLVQSSLVASCNQL
ncbi:hypothetical protein HD554DRAFT_2038638 [Boletus coccyginus]|nr:hypothetical protein HD554DRAFT_2038638 [Boletus coccyginus]